MISPTGADKRRGPLRAGEQVQLTDPKGRQHLLMLRDGANFHTHRGLLAHDAIIGLDEGSVVVSAGSTPYVVFRPLLPDYVLAMPRGAAVVYPKDSAQIIGLGDIYPGARVVEAGAGSGALSCALLHAVGDGGFVSSYERREEFADVARKNVERFFGGPHPSWKLTVGDLRLAITETDVDRVVLDMLAPWEVLDAVSNALRPGGVIICYVATTTQLSRTVEGLREIGTFAEPAPFESFLRGWHVEGLAVRPDHRMVGHTGFLVTARKMADGVAPPPRRRRPAKSAGDDTSVEATEAVAGPHRPQLP